MKDCQPGPAFTDVAGEGSGEGVSVYVRQAPGDPGGWWLNLYCETGDGHWQFVRSFVLTAPFRYLSRLFARETVPGATRWKAQVQSPAGATQAIQIAIQAGCPFQRCGVVSNGKGFGYASGVVDLTVNVPPGAEIREITLATGATAATVQIAVLRDATAGELLPVITVPSSTDYTFPEETLEGLFGATAIQFAGAASWTVAWKE